MKIVNTGSKCPVGTRRMVKANRMPTTIHKPIFRLPYRLPNPQYPL
ncbi:hypothetical protein [Kingella sp. (in: b-proteobacteria)]|nr:hypothetical protein [Kingella sp. (in: b-proteobacteria)]MDO4657971.1 hypothetical protein [Kingella sp. (in: b-proteobacteria)]